ncbi:hypothetical protein RRG08_032152 [Elysia crispata]|uniref:Uncharacterized protein n=1 Tax=Elysia crispata TaxID=231223 RepID=A0AAE1DVL5_9GAST|nr:hypothetical protein RRG08_032152 [Elysia crispata]
MPLRWRCDVNLLWGANVSLSLRSLSSDYPRSIVHVTGNLKSADSKVDKNHLTYYLFVISRLAWDKKWEIIAVKGNNSYTSWAVTLLSGSDWSVLSRATKSRLLLFRSRYCFLALVSFSNLSLRVLNGHLTEAHRLNHSIGPGTAQFNGHLVPFSLSQLHTRLDAMNGESREGILKNFETSWYIKCLPITDLDVWNSSVKLSSSTVDSNPIKEPCLLRK